MRTRPIASLLAVTGVLALVLLGSAPAMADPVPPASVLDQSNSTTNASCGSGLLSEAAQTFTAGITGSLTAVGISIAVNNPGNTTLSIQGTIAGSPDGIVLGTGSYVGAFTGVVALAAPVPVTSGTQYAIVFPTGSLSYNCNGFSSYAGGSLLFNDSPWSDTGEDMVFSTYVRPAGIPVTTDTAAGTLSDTAVTVPLQETGTITGRALDTAPASGSVSFSGATAIYTPNPGFTGTDSFVYHATNAVGGSIPATVTITVTAPAVVKPTLATTGADPLPNLLVGVVLLLLGLALVVIDRLHAPRRASV
ncbi:MAG: Ig-like domain-containing protein [Actinomycetota bacterium]